MARGPSRGDERSLVRARRSREKGALQVGHARVALAYPSPYRAGMSSLGFQTLYRQLNTNGIPTHRVFLPDAWERMALPWPQPRRPLLSYEDERPLSDYPIIGVSVAYELEIAGLIRMLEGSGIPLLAADRGPRDPIIIGGGPLTFSNPSSILPFVDLLIVGEAEALLPEAIHRIESTAKRVDAIELAAALPHTCTGELTPGKWPELPEPARADKSLLPAHSQIVSPDTELANMFLVEPERGCSRRCTFCVMRGADGGGMRLLDYQTPLSLVPDYAPRVGLVGAAVTDHPKLEQLVSAIVESGRGVGISSLRADRLNPDLLNALAKSGHRTITVASDGISERMRKALNRGIKEEHLLRAAKLIRAHNYHRMKVYQMMGAPGETDEDVDELIRFARELASIQRLTLTFSTFVAKRYTPLDGLPFMGVKAAEQRLKKIRQGLAGKVELRPQSPRWAHIEYFLAQWGPEAGHAAIKAVHAGARYADWVRAFEQTPRQTRTLRYGDEKSRARRTGFAKDRPRLPVVA